METPPALGLKPLPGPKHRRGRLHARRRRGPPGASPSGRGAACAPPDAGAEGRGAGCRPAERHSEPRPPGRLLSGTRWRQEGGALAGTPPPPPPRAQPQSQLPPRRVPRHPQRWSHQCRASAERTAFLRRCFCLHIAPHNRSEGRGACRGADAEEGGQLFRSSRPSACALFAPKQLLSRVRIKEPPAVNQETLGSGFGVPHTSPSVCHFALSSTRSCGPGRAGPGGGLRLPWRRSLGFPQHTHFVCC